MKMWRVIWYDGVEGPQVQWCATQREALTWSKEQRERDVSAGNEGFDWPQVNHADVPTRRSELAAWLNARSVECWQ